MEDIIGLKIQAIANDDSRRNKDLADIEALLASNRQKVDWSLLREYFSLFSFEGPLNELQAKYGGLK